MSQVNNSQHPHHKSKQSVVINSVLKDEKSCQTELDDTESNQKNKSKEAKEHEKEIAKWKKAYFHEKQNHKATKEVLDQALALSMKLLEEVKTLDVKLYQETERNKRLKVATVNYYPNKDKDSCDRGTSGSPSKIINDEHSGSSYSQFIRKSTEEIENIIRRIQFDSDKKKSAEKPPQPPKTQK